MWCSLVNYLVNLLSCLVNCLVQFCECDVQFFKVQFSKLSSTLGLLTVWSSIRSMLYYAMWCSVNVGSFVVVFSQLLGSILQCDIQLLWVHSVIVYHVGNKLKLAVLNTWETNTIAIFSSCQACLVWLYIVQCGAQLTFGSFVLWCLVNCLVQFCNAMFNTI